VTPRGSREHIGAAIGKLDRRRPLSPSAAFDVDLAGRFVISIIGDGNIERR
jgi:hypothetical protein